MPRTKKRLQDGCYMGLDNGTSGSIGFIAHGVPEFHKTPIFHEQSYTKKKANISRVATDQMKDLIISMVHRMGRVRMCLIERPMVNPARFKASVSAVRCLEAQLIVLESMEIPIAYIDSKEWQGILLPRGTKGPPELKKASVDIGCRLFPSCKELIVKHKDADGLLIAEYCRRTYDT